MYACMYVYIYIYIHTYTLNDNEFWNSRFFVSSRSHSLRMSARRATHFIHATCRRDRIVLCHGVLATSHHAMSQIVYHFSRAMHRSPHLRSHSLYNTWQVSYRMTQKEALPLKPQKSMLDVCMYIYIYIYIHTYIYIYIYIYIVARSLQRGFCRIH